MKSALQIEFITHMDSHRAILYKVARMYCSNEDDREDLVQDMYHQLWRSYPRYNPQYKFSTWMYRVALNVAISAYRKKSKTITQPLNEEMTKDADKETNPAVKQLLAAIESLPPLDRAIILLQMEGNSYEDISEVAGISESNVGTRLNRIKKRIKTIIETQNKY